jgi:acyl-coenzyme A thioesterase PaaI-like protein
MTLSDEELATRHRRHILTELRFSVRRELAETGRLTGEAELTPFMHVPGTSQLRTSILVIWADTLGGILSLPVLQPRVPVTLELDVHLYRPAPGVGRLTAVCKTVKSGRAVHVVESEFMDCDGTVFAFSTGSFMASRDASLSAPTATSAARLVAAAPALSVPLGERAGVSRVAAGVAELPMTPEGINSSNTLNGGLIAMACEEAVLSRVPAGTTLQSLAVRYLSPVRTGPAIASAEGGNGLYRVELRDEGAAGRLATLATARTF